MFSTWLAHRNLMARHLPFRVYEFAARVRPLYYGDMLTVVPGRFIGELSEDPYNIWMMDLRK